jgi:hypothetical protein
MANTRFQTQEGSNQNIGFLNCKNYTPLETKANKNKRQTQTRTPTPPKVEITKFYQLILDKPQDKHKPHAIHRPNPSRTNDVHMSNSLGCLVNTKLIGELEATIILPCQQGKQAKSLPNENRSNHRIKPRPLNRHNKLKLM